ncbi:NfeD family protein [Amaricoccus tamworthensis]|uniref:NfeD family protein n=1 Tax=Amaricoccus tamworthensis TaxID=57002 RepID=UPI003C7E591B
MEPAEVASAVSPWWWLGAGIAFAALEMLTATTYLIWPALAAIVVFVTLLLIPGLSLMAQLTIFALLTIALVFVGKALFFRKKATDAAARLNDRTGTIIGKTGTIDREGHSEPKVIIDGIPWPIREPDTPLAHHTKVRVTAKDGIVLEVQPVTKS